MADDHSDKMENELAFLSAMQAYRAARDSGDATATAEAEEAWRNLVRNELHEKGEGA